MSRLGGAKGIHVQVSLSSYPCSPESTSISWARENIEKKRIPMILPASPAPHCSYPRNTDWGEKVGLFKGDGVHTSITKLWS